jgi:ribosomal protein S6--L-glutamate ligase
MHVVDHLKCDLVHRKKGRLQLFYNSRLEGFDAVIPRTGASVTFMVRQLLGNSEMMKKFYCGRSHKH